MIPYLYAPLQMRATPHQGEWRIIGVLAIDLAYGEAYTAHLPLSKVVRWPAHQLKIAKEVIQDIEAEGKHIAAHFHTSHHRSVAAWWESRAARCEDFVRLCPPRPGITEAIQPETFQILRDLTGW